MDKQERLWRSLRRLRCKWQRDRRLEKQLVVLDLQASSVIASCWQADCCLWQKEKALDVPWQEGCAEWWRELERALQDVFIWARVPDRVDTLMLLGEELVFSELVEFPQISEQEILQAIPWEAEQLVPWEQGSYNTAFATSGRSYSDAVRALGDINNLQVQLWAWPTAQVAQACSLTKGLRLELGAILVGLSSHKAQEAWYKGLSFKNWSLKEGQISWQQRAGELAQGLYPQRVCTLCLVLSLLLYGASQGGGYLASYSLDKTKEELASYAVWQQRLNNDQKLQAALQRYQQLDKRVQAGASHISKSVNRLGQQVGAGCWLELMRGQNIAKEWQLEGACYEVASMNRLVENMEQDPKLGQVRLLSSQQQGKKLSFSVMVKEK